MGTVSERDGRLWEDSLYGGIQNISGVTSQTRSDD
jgi:hypothetical protein